MDCVQRAYLRGVALGVVEPGLPALREGAVGGFAAGLEDLDGRVDGPY
jgi:hypothetical protein